MFVSDEVNNQWVQRRPLPLLAALASVGLAILYAYALGYEIRVTDYREVATFVLYFGALGAGVAFAVQSFPAAAIIGAVSHPLVSVFRTWVGGWAAWPVSFTALSTAGAIAFGLFLLGFGAELLQRRPEMIRSAINSRAFRLGVVVGVAVAVPVSLAWEPEPTRYGTATALMAHYTIVMTQFLILVAGFSWPVYLSLRFHAVLPALAMVTVLYQAWFLAGDGYGILSATPTYLFESGGIVLFLFVSALIILEQSVRELR